MNMMAQGAFNQAQGVYNQEQEAYSGYTEYNYEDSFNRKSQ